MSYRTYIVGTESMYYDQTLINELKASMPWFFKLLYRSNWRVLHIDGFEPEFHPLPARVGYKLDFFHYAPPGADQS